MLDDEFEFSDTKDFLESEGSLSDDELKNKKNKCRRRKKKKPKKHKRYSATNDLFQVENSSNEVEIE